MPATYRGNTIYVSGSSTTIPGPVHISGIINKSSNGFQLQKAGDGTNLPMYQPVTGDQIPCDIRSASGITVVQAGAATGIVILLLKTDSSR